MPLSALSEFLEPFHLWLTDGYGLFCLLSKIPQGLRNAFKVVCCDHEERARANKVFVWIIFLKCGLLQGCPLSGPPLRQGHRPLRTLFDKYIHTPVLGQVYACADDIGAALENLKSLRSLFRLFENLRKATGLTLNPSKCVAIVVSISLSELNLRMIRQFIAQLIPKWKNLEFFNVRANT